MKELFLAFLQALTPGSTRPAGLTPPSTPGGETVVIRNDHRLESIPAKAPVPGRRHIFADVSSFAAFVKKHMPDGASVEVLAGATEITAINGAVWFRDQVSCVLTPSPDLVSWERLFAEASGKRDPKTGLGAPIGQRELVRELQARSHTLGSDSPLGALQMIRLATGEEMEASVTENGNYDIKGSTSRTSMGTKLPGGFTVKCPIYLDGPDYVISVALVIENTVGGVTFSLRPKNIDQVKLDAYRAEVENLRTLLGDGYLVGAGKLALEA